MSRLILHFIFNTLPIWIKSLWFSGIANIVTQGKWAIAICFPVTSSFHYLNIRSIFDKDIFITCSDYFYFAYKWIIYIKIKYVVLELGLLGNGYQ